MKSIAIACVAVALALRVQPSPSMILGTVVEWDNAGQPIRHVQVTLTRSDGTGQTSTTTDEVGRFRFTGLAAGRYRLTASKAGWLDGGVDAARPGQHGGFIALDAAATADVMLKLARGGVVAGRVLDTRGAPLPGIPVNALRASAAIDAGRFDKVGQTATPVTDALGEYRIYGLPPGRYLIAAIPPPATRRVPDAADVRRAFGGAFAQPMTPSPVQRSGYSPVFYPSAPDVAGAMPVTLEIGKERLDVDIQLGLVPTGSIAGTVGSMFPLDPNSVRVTLVPMATGALFGASRTVTSKGGGFVFPDVIAGAYTIVARGAAPSRASGTLFAPSPSPRLDTTLYAVQEFRATGTDDTVSLDLLRAGSVSGSVHVEEKATLTEEDFRSMQIQLVSADGRPWLTIPYTIPNGAHEFAINGVPPGRYHLVCSAPRMSSTGWFVESAKLGDDDLLDTMIDLRAGVDLPDIRIQLTDKPTQLSGTIRTPEARPVTSAVLVVFSKDRLFWTRLSRRVVKTPVDSNGAFSVKGLPAGDYYLVALTDFDPTDDFYASTTLDQWLSSAVSVTLVTGQSTTQDLLIPVRR
jgi:hypothetical protein